MYVNLLLLFFISANSLHLLPTLWQSYKDVSMLPRIAATVALVYVLVVTKSFVSGASSFENRTGGILLDYHMNEELPAGTRIGNLAIDSGLTVERGHSEAGSYRYSLFPSAFRDYFEVEAIGGLLKTSEKSFDRDGLCGDREVCAATLDVNVVMGHGQFQFVRVKVYVEDLNDNSPLFQPDRLSLFVSEAALPGTIFLISAAIDSDFGELGVKSYRLDGDRSRVLRLETTSPTVDAGQLRLVLQEKLDRETEHGLQLRITAVDGGSPPRTGVLTVDVVVQDANDNSPVFLKNSYTVEVEEGKVFEGPLLRVSATDPDEGDSGRVVYDFNKATSASCGSDFTIGNTTGEIFLRRGLDFERRSSYELVVIASDLGLGSLRGTANVVVTVTDVNDNVPEIYVMGDSLHATSEAAEGRDGQDTVHRISVPENQSPDAFIAQIFVTDQDAGRNGEVVCSTGSEDFRLEKEHDALPGLFKLAASAPLDREMRSEFTVTLRCADRGLLPHESRKMVTVSLIDINDNEPRFTESEYITELPESSGSGLSILTVTAVDRDLAENGRVSYHLLGNDVSREVVIDRDTGVIRTGLSPVDRETAEWLVFSVVATDHGTPNLTAAVMVRVRIIDVNDVAPRFSATSYSFSCVENLSPGSWVGTVSAVDIDQPPFNAFLFSITVASALEPANILRDYRHEPFVSQMNKHVVTDLPHGSQSTIQWNAKFGNSKEIPFEIDKTSGRISMTRTLDREWQSSFSFIVVATDVEPPYLNSTVPVTVLVTDVNDNAPVIETLTPNTDVFIPMATAVGSTVLRVAATDADDALNSKLSYSIVQGNEDDLFSVDSDKGDVHLVRSPPSMSYNKSYDLIIMVSDGGQPQLTVNTSVSLTFSDGGSEGALNSIGVTLLQHNEAVLLLVIGSTSCVVAILIIAISYTKRLQLEERRAKQTRYFDVRTTVTGFGSNRSRTGSSVCLETPSPLHSSDNERRSRSSCLDEYDTRAFTTEESSKRDSNRSCCTAGEREGQQRRNHGQVKNAEVRSMLTHGCPRGFIGSTPPFK